MNRKERRATAKQTRAARPTGASAEVERKIAQAIALSQSQSFDEAEQILHEVRRKDPGNAEAKHHLGMIMARTGRGDAGIALLREAVAIRPGEALYWNNLAACCLAVHRLEEGIEAAKRAVELDPKYVMAWENLGLAYRDLKRSAEAADAFSRAAQGTELDAASLRAWGSCLYDLHDLPAAERLLRKAVTQDDADASGWSLLGEILQDQGRGDEAREGFRRALDRDPGQLGAAMNYGSLLVRIPGEVDAGLRWLRRATSIAPRSAPAWRILAAALTEAGRSEEAAEAVRHATRLAAADAKTSEHTPSAPVEGALSLADTGLEMEIGKPQPAAKPMPGGGLDLTLLDIKE